jgi:hypothetical protein
VHIVSDVSVLLAGSILWWIPAAAVEERRDAICVAAALTVLRVCSGSARALHPALATVSFLHVLSVLCRLEAILAKCAISEMRQIAPRQRKNTAESAHNRGKYAR